MPRQREEGVTPKGWTISKRGNYWEITFENTRAQVSVTLSDSMFAKFISDSSGKLEVAHSGKTL